MYGHPSISAVDDMTITSPSSGIEDSEKAGGSSLTFVDSNITFIDIGHRIFGSMNHLTDLKAFTIKAKSRLVEQC